MSISKKNKIDKALNEALEATESDTKIRVTTYIDGDVYMALKKEANESGVRYQALLNKYLRASVLQEYNKSDLKAVIAALSKLGKQVKKVS